MKIMLYANDPGGANAISPLVEPLRERGHEIYVFANLSALQILNCKEYSNELRNIMPDILITGTSAKNLNERYLWQEAKNLKIKTIAFVEYWGNYGIRFSDISALEIEKFNGNCNMLPDYIIVPDDFAKEEAIKEGVPSNLIYPLGNPHFQNIYSKLNFIENKKTNFVDENETLITYASQPFTEDLGKPGEELNVLEDIIDSTDKKILVKLHPKEDFSKFDKYKDKVMLNKEMSMPEIIKASDLVISINSMVLLEAMIIKKPIIAYQRNETDKNKFILTKFGIIPFINNKTDFQIELKNKLLNHNIILCDNFIRYDSIKNIIKFAEEDIWQQN